MIPDTDVLCVKMIDRQYGKEGLMKKRIGLQIKWKTLMGAMVLLAALTVGLNVNSFISLADSAGKITASSAKIRKEPSTTSETVGSAVQDAKVSVTGQITGSDGYTWYKVVVDGGTVGYIRSDLMEITDGSTPASVVAPTTTTTTATPTTSTPDEQLVEVANVEPVSASVKGSSPVRVRQNASTTSRIVTNAEGGMALTVIGQANGADNKEWYLVQFIANGSEVSGFIRADYVVLSGELVPAGSVVEEPVEEQPEETEEPKEPAKAWETYYTEDDSKWHLLDNTTGNSYDIAQIFSSVEANTKTLQDTLKENKNQQVIIVVMVILIVVLATAVSLLFFKMKDLADAAYYNEVEQETMRRRTADRPVSKGQSSQRTMQTVGAEGGKRPAGGRPAGGQNGQRPASGQGGQRPTGGQNGQRPAGSQGGQRPAGGQNGQRPAGSQGGQRPTGAQGARPAGGRPTGAQGGQRPTGSQGTRPTEGRPAGAQSGQRPAGSQGARPAGGRPVGAQGGQRSAGGQGARPVSKRPVQVQEPEEEMVQNIFTDDTVVYDRADVEQVAKAAEQIQHEENAGWKAKNFTNEDELEFHFLNLEDSDK